MRDNLEQYRKWIETTRKPIEGFRFQSYEGLVLDLGRSFTQIESPFERGPMKDCYSNALNIAMLHGGFWYCEGYAASPLIGLPIQHAWICNDQGEAIEVTWPYENSTYFGVAFEVDFVAKHVLHTGYYGVLANDWLDDHSLLRNGIPESAIPDELRKEESR